MSTFFALVHLAALVAFIVFLVKTIKLKKAGADNSKAKKIMIGSAIAWFVALILVGVTAPPSETTEEATTETSAEPVAETTEEAPKEEAPATEGGEQPQA